MTFAKTKPTGWSPGEKLAAAQINDIDAKTANAVDKTGDTIPGAQTFSQRATFNSGADLADVTNVVDGGEVDFLSGASCNFGSGSQNIIFAGATQTVMGQVRTASGGRIVLGDNDYPEFSAARSMTRLVPLGAVAIRSDLASSFALDPHGVKSIASSAPALRFYMPQPLAGAQLTNARLRFTPKNGHAGLPANNISFGLYSYTFSAGVAAPSPTLIATATYSPSSLSNYNAGLVQELQISPNVAIVPDQYAYVWEIIDESGSNSLYGAVFHSILLGYSLSDLRNL